MTQAQRTLLRTLLAACLLLALCAAPAMAVSYSAMINSSGATIHSGAGTSGSLPKGTSVTVKDVSDGWAKISYKGLVGYVKIQYLTAKDGVTGYASKDTSVYKGASSSSGKLASLSKGSKLEVVGVNGSYYQVASGSAYGYVAKNCVSRTKPASQGSTNWKSKVELVNWFDGGSSILSKGEYAYIYDIDTGLTVRIRCLYGSNHADVEPATKADTAKLLKIAGGSFSWDSHAVILYADGRFIAAGINTMPHGEQAIDDNGYDGQFCLHLLGSKTHGSDTVNTAHQASIKRAYSWARGSNQSVEVPDGSSASLSCTNAAQGQSPWNSFRYLNLPNDVFRRIIGTAKNEQRQFAALLSEGSSDASRKNKTRFAPGRIPLGAKASMGEAMLIFLRRCPSERTETNMKNLTTRSLTRAALIAALYCLLTLVFQPISFGAVQFRISEALTLLPVLFPEAVPGLFVGCLLANMFSPNGFVWFDVLFGSIATLLAAACSHKTRSRPLLSAAMPVIFNGLIVGPVVYLAYVRARGEAINWLLMYSTIGTVALGEAVVCYVLGLPLLRLLKRLPPDHMEA